MKISIIPKTEKTKTGAQKALRAGLVLLFWLGVWAVCSLLVNKELLLPPPWKTAARLFALMGTKKFWLTCLRSLGSILLGFLAGTCAGTVLAVLTARFAVLRALFLPLIRVVRATPVASFIILALVFLRRAYVPPFIASLMVFPVLWANVSEGIAGTDSKLLEKSRVYAFSRWKTVRYVYLPQVFPYFRAGAITALGLSWKSGIAAEVLGLPGGTVGAHLHDAQVYLESVDLFAWTAVVILLSMLLEALIAKALGAVVLHSRVRAGGEKPKPVFPQGTVQKTLHKAYGDKTVLQDFHLVLPPSGVTALVAPSGSGKTTVLRLLCGLEQDDAGETPIDEPCAYLFQEDRLLPQLTVEQNILVAEPSADVPTLLHLMELPAETARQLPKTLSGGMQRRVALAVLLARAQRATLILLDEPFQGLDEALRDRIAPHFFARLQKKRVVLVSHSAQEVAHYAQTKVLLP